MATTITEAVKATLRSGKFNKNAARRVRVSGLIPAVIYGAGQESQAITVDPKSITKILYSESGHNSIFDLNIEGGAGVKAMIVDWQYEPVKGSLLHIDLKRIAMDKTMKVSVPVLLSGIPVGVKTGGGVLDHILREIEVECLPNDIPSHIDVDVSGLELYGAVHVSDLPHTGSVKFLAAEETLIAHVSNVKEEAAAEVVAGAAEPEVTKGKGKTEAAAPAAGAKAPAAKAPAKK
jgi:large subunit ribosomal protein L25